ncbi:MFS general substrate transporter [Clavulina sp. PMI_390]|nr:MFS general substrate transporter [Clavulina sp. PMI_390]
MLAIFCFAEFNDAFSVSCLFPAITPLSASLHPALEATEVSWVFSAYSATFAAFLLISGRISDIYNSRVCFISGAFLIGVFSLGAGFTKSKIVFFLLRALAGVGAALNLPSAVKLIVQWFPNPREQTVAIAIYGAGGGIGTVLGGIVGGIFVQYVTWRWILWFTGIVCIATSFIAVIVVPASPPLGDPYQHPWTELDVGGNIFITVSTLLFVYALTEGPIAGWSSIECLAPLIISVILAALFFIYEATIPEDMAALPPKVWRYQNVPVLLAVALVPFWWWSTLSLNTIPYWISTYKWSPIVASFSFLPNGIVAILSAALIPVLANMWPSRRIIMLGLLLTCAGTILLAFADQQEKYWSFYVPAFIIGTSGCNFISVAANVTILLNTPSEMAGVAGAIYNAALQLAVALGVAINSSIVQSIDMERASHGHLVGYEGIAAGYWFNLGLFGIMLLGVVVFYKASDVVPSKGEIDLV